MRVPTILCVPAGVVFAAHEETQKAPKRVEKSPGSPDVRDYDRADQPALKAFTSTALQELAPRRTLLSAADWARVPLPHARKSFLSDNDGRALWAGSRALYLYANEAEPRSPPTHILSNDRLAELHTYYRMSDLLQKLKPIRYEAELRALTKAKTRLTLEQCREFVRVLGMNRFMRMRWREAPLDNMWQRIYGLQNGDTIFLRIRDHVLHPEVDRMMRPVRPYGGTGRPLFLARRRVESSGS